MALETLKDQPTRALDARKARRVRENTEGTNQEKGLPPAPKGVIVESFLPEEDSPTERPPKPLS